MSWEQVLRYTRLQKRYISLYASLLKSDPSQVTISGSREIEDLDRELDIELILQWRYAVILGYLFCMLILSCKNHGVRHSLVDPTITPKLYSCTLCH